MDNSNTQSSFLPRSSEAVSGAVPAVNNSPQKPPLGLRTERISGGSFVAPRELSYQTWLYRLRASIAHSDWARLRVSGADEGYGPPSPVRPANVTPNSRLWGGFPAPAAGSHWANGQQLLGRNGDPQAKEGMALWVFSVTASMPPRQAFASLDGEALVIPQSGALDIQTELGRLVVRQNEIAVIPRNVRYRVCLPEGKPCRGYVCELYQGHFRLPDLGVIGSTGLANVRDFQVPKAFVDATVHSHLGTTQAPGPGAPTGVDDGEWSIVARLVGNLWHCTQAHTPFDVVGWHGTCYPFKYDLARFCALGNLVFDEHDPSLFVVLTARHHGAEPTTAVVDFAVIPPRWMAARDTNWLPYFHRNTMQEFFGPIVALQDGAHPLNATGETNRFAPFGAGLNGCMSTHGPSERDFQAARARDTTTPAFVGGDEGVTIFLVETERPLLLSDWAMECSDVNLAKVSGRL